jgi:DNA invertase Pin-like site-specific DNA recombinase
MPRLTGQPLSQSCRKSSAITAAAIVGQHHLHHQRRSNMPKRVALYVRVSTDGQTVQNQLGELRQVAGRHGWHIVHTYADEGISGIKGREGRPEFDKLLKAIARREVDMVAAWSVDRLGRSLKDLVSFLSDLQAKEVDLFLYQQGLDTSTPSGRAMFQMLGVFSEFEAAMIRDRVRTGVARAQKHGTKSGKAIGRPKLSEEIELVIRKELLSGRGQLAIAKSLGVGTGTVSRVAKQMRTISE